LFCRYEAAERSDGMEDLGTPDEIYRKFEQYDWDSDDAFKVKRNGSEG
jgi:hypothetical protein